MVYVAQSGFTSAGGLDLSRRYAIEAGGDPIYGESAVITDLTAFGAEASSEDTQPED